jgi:hypothetical protein
MTEHKRVIQCSCGETFDSEENFELHKHIQKRKVFDKKAQEWFEDHTGGEIVSYHDELMGMGGGFTAYLIAKEQDDIGTEPTDENVRDACILFLQDALKTPNVEMLFYDEFHDE